MKVRKRKGGSDARLALSSMITDTDVLGAVASRWDDAGLFGSKAENIIAQWCIDHHKKFNKAPGRHVQHYFERYSEKRRDNETTEFIGSFLQSMSDEYRSKNPVAPEVALDAASRVFDRVRLQKLKEELEASIESGNLEAGFASSAKLHRIEIVPETGHEILRGGALVRNAFKGVSDSLITWDQDGMKMFFEDILSREEFVVFQGPEGSGKSFWLQEVAMQSILNGRRTAFFEVGDQTFKQITRRFAARIAKRPFKKDRGYKYPTTLRVSGGEEDENGNATAQLASVEYKMKSCEKKMMPKEASSIMRKFGKKHGAHLLRLSVHPNNSINMPGIAAILNDWARDNWVADVVIVDYLDILAPIEGNAETRDQINQTWQAARRLSQEMHCLFVGATQADADAYTAKLQTKKNFSNDKRKNAHVTGMIGINQSDAEKERGVYRLNWIKVRDLEFSGRKCVFTAPCLAIANPCVHSSF